MQQIAQYEYLISQRIFLTLRAIATVTRPFLTSNQPICQPRTNPNLRAPTSAHNPPLIRTQPAPVAAGGSVGASIELVRATCQQYQPARAVQRRLPRPDLQPRERAQAVTFASHICAQLVPASMCGLNLRHLKPSLRHDTVFVGMGLGTQ